MATKKKPARTPARKSAKKTPAKKAAAKKTPAKKQAAKKPAAKQSTAKASSRKAAARRPASGRAATATAKKKPVAAKKKPAVKLVSPRAKRSTGEGPPPPPADAVEVSGIYERVMYSESDPYQEVREIFGHYDRDRSGVIDASEFARLCEALGMEMEDDVLQAGLSVVDSDGDGKISWDEFLGWWRSLGR